MVKNGSKNGLSSKNPSIHTNIGARFHHFWHPLDLPAVFGDTMYNRYCHTFFSSRPKRALFGRAHHNTHGPGMGNVPSGAIYDVGRPVCKHGNSHDQPTAIRNFKWLSIFCWARYVPRDPYHHITSYSIRSHFITKYCTHYCDNSPASAVWHSRASAVFPDFTQTLVAAPGLNVSSSKSTTRSWALHAHEK